MAFLFVFKWLPYLILLQIFSSIITESSRYGHKPIMIQNITAINATKNSLTLTAKGDCIPHICATTKIVWQYSQGQNLWTTWEKADEKIDYHNGHYELTISGLQPGTVYFVRAFEWMESPPNSHDDKFIPTVQAITCPETPKKVSHIHIYDKGTDHLKAWWAAPDRVCLSNAYYVRWFEYIEEEHDLDKITNAGDCPADGVFVANTTLEQCEDDPEYICYTINENITSATRYIVEVFTTDASGICSEAENTYAKSAFGYWGGITVGGWCLIAFCFVLAIGAAPLVIRMKRRLAMQLTSKENIMFKRTKKMEDCLEDDERDPDGYLISNSTDRGTDNSQSHQI